MFKVNQILALAREASMVDEFAENPRVDPSDRARVTAEADRAGY